MVKNLLILSYETEIIEVTSGKIKLGIQKKSFLLPGPSMKLKEVPGTGSCKYNDTSCIN